MTGSLSYNVCTECDIKLIVFVGRCYPTSQTCSCCGHRNIVEKDLNVRH